MARSSACFIARSYLFRCALSTLSGRACGNDELGLEFADISVAASHMLRWGEITQQEADAAKPLDALVDKWSGNASAGFWRREAL